MGKVGSESKIRNILLSSIGVVALVAVPTDKDSLNSLFSKFVKEHGKVYATRAELIHRQKVFAQNLQKIEDHNRSGASYKMGKTLLPMRKYRK